MLVSGFRELIALLVSGLIAESSGPFLQAVSALLFLATVRQILLNLGFRIGYFFNSGPQNFSLFRTPQTIADSE